MRFAYDKNKNRIHINQAHIKEQYYDEFEDEVIQKRGNIRVEHFAHKSNSQFMCYDGWHYDMSYWHCNWQDKFPSEMQEVVRKSKGKIHRADVLIEEKKLVIEFQYSSLSAEEFKDRNEFYNDLGYKVIWIFDVSNDYWEGKIKEHERKPNVFVWNRPKSTFDNLEAISENSIYLQFQNAASDDYRIIRDRETLKCSEIDDILGPEEEDYYRNNKDNDGYIGRVSWISPSGFEWFAVNNYYDTEELVNKILGIVKLNEKSFDDVYDELRYLYYKDHSKYFDGCPISNTHICVNSLIDVPEYRYKDIMPCELCKYHKANKDHDYLCLKRYYDLNLPNNAEFINVEKYDQYSLKELTVRVDGKIKTYNFDPLIFSNIGKSIIKLWEETNPKIATFRNIRTGIYIRVSKNPIVQLNKYKKVYGKISKDQYQFPENSSELYNVLKNEWVIVWKE